MRRAVQSALTWWALVLTLPCASALAAPPPAPWQPLVAQYRVTLRAAGQPVRVQTWTLWRDDQRIALLRPAEDAVWLRDASGIRLQRLYHAAHKLVDYSAGELRTLQVDARWLPLGTLFDESLLPQLRRTGPAGSPRYAGQLGSERVSLKWDAASRLPVHLMRSTAQGSAEFVRLAVHREAPGHWPVPTADRTDYDRLDAADFGDQTADPFVRQVLEQDVRIGWRSPHAPDPAKQPQSKSGPLTSGAQGR